MSEWLPRIYGNMCVEHAFALNVKSPFIMLPPARDSQDSWASPIIVSNEDDDQSGRTWHVGYG